jgi:hypothetical protein
MKHLVRKAYSWEYNGELRETERIEPEPLEEDEEIDLRVSFSFKSLNMILLIFRKL